MIKKAIKEALKEFFESKEGRALIAKAVRTAMIYEIELEKHGKDDRIEKVKKKADILAYIAAWIKRAEGAIRGCQQDSQIAKNYSAQTINAVGNYLIENDQPKKITHLKD